MTRRSILKMLAASTALISAPLLPTRLKDNWTPETPDAPFRGYPSDVIIKVPRELVEDNCFDVTRLLAQSVARVETRVPLRFHSRLDELYAETAEVGFLFRVAA